MRVRIFRDWTPSVKCDFDYKNMQLVEDESYEYAIIHNTPKPNLKIDKSRVLGFAWEPNRYRNYTSYIPYCKKNIAHYFVGSNKGLPLPFREGHSYMYNYQKESLK